MATLYICYKHNTQQLVTSKNSFYLKLLIKDKHIELFLIHNKILHCLTIISLCNIYISFVICIF